jgi:glycosyltransferase involved in cell wall biosynthesis
MPAVAAAARARLRRLPHGCLDYLDGWSVRPSVAAVRGWVLVERGYDRVEVQLGDLPPVRARLGSELRPDVAALSLAASAPMAGWQAALDVTDLPEGATVSLRAVARGPARARDLGAAEVTIGPPSRPPTREPQWVDVLAREGSGRPDVAQRSEPSHLLVFTHDLGLGGAQLYLHELLRGLLADSSLRCTVVSQADGPLRAELESWGAGVRITRPMPLEGVHYELNMRDLRALAAGAAPDLVLVNTLLAPEGADLAARLGVPLIWTIHESIPVEHWLGGYGPRVDDHVAERIRHSLRAADALVFEAEATRRLFAPQAGDAGRAIRIDSGLGLDALAKRRAGLDRERLRALHGFGARERVIVCVGTIEPRKGQVPLALAFARLARRHPDAVLVLVGDRADEYSAGLAAMLARLRLGRRIRTVPVTPEVEPWLELADAFVLPSDLESLPRSILEAMAFELPVLATRAFGVPELINDGETGLLCEPRCVAELERGLERLLGADPAELEAVGRAAGRLIRSTRDSSGYADAYRRLIGDLRERSALRDEVG